MQLRYDFSSLWKIADELGAAHFDVPIYSGGSVGTIDDQLASTGIEVDLADVQNIGGLLAYEGRQILLYIPDQGRNISDVIRGDKDKGKKFHVAHCTTLETMKNRQRFERYIATTKLDGKFHVHGINLAGAIEEDENTALYVCQNCLKLLNYQQAKIEHKAAKIREHFNLSTFFETYSSIFPYRPSRSQVDPASSGYVSGWELLSKQRRSEAKWRCSDCQVDLSTRPDLLHVHHVNGLKNDNSDQNLKVLCAACHRDQPLHEHMNVDRGAMRTIGQLRRRGGLIQPNWESILKMADPALRGVLGLAKAKGLQPPELEFVINGNEPIEVAWTRERVAISLDPENKPLAGWRVLSLREAHTHFE